jgi:hypothetical protein
VRRGSQEPQRLHAECPCSLDDYDSSVKSDDRSEHGHSFPPPLIRGFRQSRIHPRTVDVFRLDALYALEASCYSAITSAISDVVVVVGVVDVVFRTVDVVVVDVDVEPEPVAAVVVAVAAVVAAVAAATAAAPTTAAAASTPGREARACGDRGGARGGRGGRRAQAHDSAGQRRADRESRNDTLDIGHCISSSKGSVAPNSTFPRFLENSRAPEMPGSLECLR